MLFRSKNAKKKPAWQLAIVFIYSFAMLFLIFLVVIAVMTTPPGIVPFPLNETKSLLTDLVDLPGALKHTPEVVFKPGDVLAASALVERLPISKDQICISTGQFEEDNEDGFECIGCENASDNQRLIYHGSSDKAAKLAVVCNVNLKNLLDDIDAYNLEDGDGKWDGTSIEDACDVCDGLGKCCAIVLKRS